MKLRYRDYVRVNAPDTFWHEAEGTVVNYAYYSDEPDEVLVRTGHGDEFWIHPDLLERL